MPTNEKSTFSHFFKEDADIIQSIIKGTEDKQPINNIGLAKNIFPKISCHKEVSENEFVAQWRAIRSFFRSGKNASGLSKGMSPVIASPLYTDTLIGTDFPVWIADENFNGDGGCCLSLKEVLINSLDEIISEVGNANILNNSIDRIIHIANKQLSDKPELFRTVINQVLDELAIQLDVTGNESETFKINLNNLRNKLPNNGVLLPYTNNTSFQVLDAAMFATLKRSRIQLTQNLNSLRNQLSDLLRVEEEKNPKKGRTGLSNSIVNFDEVSLMTPSSGSVCMEPERIQRITTVIDQLEGAEALLKQGSFLFIDEILYKNKNIDWENLFENNTIEIYNKGAACASLSTIFNDHIAAWTKLFVAARVGALEVDNAYQADVHNDFFAHFSFENFSTAELINCPHFVMIADDVQLFETELSQLSAMLSNNIPAKVVAVKRNNFGGTDLHTQTELGALMLSHKNIYVAQSTSITPKYLFNNFVDGLNSFSPAFFNVLNVDKQRHQNPYLWTSAAVESRDFPSFTYKGTLGASWGSRFEVDHNPQADLQYPVHELMIVNAKDEEEKINLSFSFADFVALSADNHHYFMQVDSTVWNENLIPLTEYIANNAEDNIAKIPYIWMVDSSNELQKVAVSWDIVLATQERLDFWRFLQENSGINNYHVARAVENAKAQMQEQFNKDIQQLESLHKTEIQSIRDEESEKVMENLTSVLLNIDTTNLAATSATALGTVTSIASATETTENIVEEAPEEEESILSNDPYIDTPLCTSCNECINMNGQLFNYNGDKMAFIADAKAGSFKELVEAAELCPVEIIHPGSPLNPDEADLDDLIDRAAKFNQ